MGNENGDVMGIRSSSISLARLNEFVVFSKHLNITRASKELYISQSRLSQHIALLEKELGFPLTVRKGGRHVRLTAQGKIFCERVQLVLQDLEDVVKVCSSQQDSSNVVLNLAISPMYASDLFVLARRAYEAAYPSATVSLTYSNQQNGSPLLAVDRGDSHATPLFLFPERKAGLEDSYELLLLKSDPPVLFIPFAHELFNKDAVSLRDLDGLTLLFNGDAILSEYYNGPLMCALEERGVRIRPILHTETDSGNFELEDYSFPSIIPRSYKRDGTMDAHGKYLLLEDASFTIDLYLVYRRENLNAAQNEYLDVLRAVAADRMI